MGIDEAVRAISLAMGTTSLVCSATTLLLIRSMKKTNGYLLLLSTITVFQILYDINYILRFATTDAACYAGQFLDLVGGLGVSFWTNILTFSVTYTIIRCKSVQVFKHYPLFSVLGSVFPLVVGIFALSSAAISTDDDSYGCSYADNSDGDALGGIYYWGRFVSVIFTIALCIYNFIRLRDRLAPHAESSTEIRTAKLHDYSRMYTSIYRMNFYSLAQIISRSGAAWNEWDYGAFSCDASEIMAAICSPSMGILNFLIFLVSHLFALFSTCSYSSLGLGNECESA